MGSSEGTGKACAEVVRFRIDPEKIGSAIDFLMHYDGLRFIDVILIGTLDVLIKKFFSGIEFLQSRTFFDRNNKQISGIKQSQLLFRSEFQSEFLKNTLLHT